MFRLDFAGCLSSAMPTRPWLERSSSFLITMHRSTFPLFVIALLLFLVFGSVLPDPVGQYSTKMRNATNQFVIGLFPKGRPKLTPHERTEKQLEDLQQGQ